MRVFVLFGFLVLLFAVVFVRTRLKSSNVSRLNWDELLARLEPVSVDGISTIAEDYLQPTKGQISLEPTELWTLVGGADGLQRMYANAEILMAIAGYAQRWNFDESVVVCERMRNDGVVLRRAMFKLLIGVFLGNNKILGPFRIQEAASAYYLMRQRLLALYESSHAGRYSTLVAAL
jgi:hypothetical protein